MSEQQAPRSVTAIVALVLGVIALSSSWVPIINNLSFVFALVGVVFAVVGLVGTLRGKKSGRGLAIASTVVNVVAVAIVLATQSAYSAAIDETSDETSVAAPAAGETTSAESADKYSIDGEELTGDAYSCKISGVYTNKVGKDLNYVQVSYNLFDADGNQIGTALANTNNLADGGTWKFEAFGSAAVDEVASYKIGDVTGF